MEKVEEGGILQVAYSYSHPHTVYLTIIGMPYKRQVLSSLNGTSKCNVSPKLIGLTLIKGVYTPLVSSTTIYVLLITSSITMYMLLITSSITMYV